MSVIDDQGRTGSDMVNNIRSGTELRFWSNVDYQGSLSCVWDFGDGSQQEDEDRELMHTYTEPGEYTVSLTATDGMGRADSCSMTIKVREEHQPRAQVDTPTANTVFNVGTAIDFQASNPGLEDFYGEIDNWTWALGDGSERFKQVFSHKYDTSGYYNVTLTVRNDTYSVLSQNSLMLIFSPTTKIRKER